ncbi:glycosyltransferase [Vagococcus entomophilus]
MKKLLVTASTFPRYKHDTEPSFIYDLCKEYTKYYDVTVLVPAAPGAKDFEEMEGMHVIRYHYFPIKKLETLCYPGAIVPRIKEKKVRMLLVPFLFCSMFFNLKKIIKHFDFVHCNWLIPQGIIQAFFKKPYILTGLGGDVTSLNRGIVKKLKQKSVNNAKVVTAVSHDLKKELEKVYHAQNVKVIPMGCDLSLFSPENRKEKLFGDDGKKIILFVGRLAEKKGAQYLIQAIEKLENIKLVIVGDGPEKKMLYELAKKSKQEILFLGSKNKTELQEIYASCDVFCVPSVIAKDGDKDGLPVALIEAMASGSPVVASDVGGIGEAVINGENGYLIQPEEVEELAESLKKILDDKILRKDFSIQARKKAEEFDFQKIGEEYKTLFDAL